jgi:hypothetical protein
MLPRRGVHIMAPHATRAPARALARRPSARWRRARRARGGANRRARATREDDEDESLASASPSGTFDALRSVLGESLDDDDATEGDEDARASSAGATEAMDRASAARRSTTRARGDSTAASGRGETPRESDADGADASSSETPEKAMMREYLSLLVAVGGVKGTLAVCLAYAAGASAFGDFGAGTGGEAMDFARAASIGLAFAAPTAIYDALVMGVDWTARAEATNEAREEASGEVREASALERYFEPLSRYQEEETLNNPCRSMPFWMDASVALTARVADEMLERGVVLGLLAKWLADRAVEAGFEPYEVDAPAKAAAAFGVYLVLEARLRRVQRQTRVQAFRVERNKVTGKQKLVPVSEDDIKASAEKTKKPSLKFWEKKPDAAADDESSSPLSANKAPNVAETRAFENILRGKSVKDFLDGSRSRLLFVSQSLAFVVTGGVFAPIVGGYVADAMYIIHQRNTMTRFIERALGDAAPARGAGPPDPDTVRRAQAAAFKNMLARKKRRMGRDVVDAMRRDPSISRDVNVLFQDVVRKVKRVKDIDESTAVDEVLLAVNDFAADDAAADDAADDDSGVSYAERMRAALRRVSEDMDAIELARAESPPSADDDDPN